MVLLTIMVFLHACMEKPRASTPSLVVVPKAGKSVDLNILQATGFITIPTKSLHTKITGEVPFIDFIGQVLLPEKKGSSKRFTSTSTDDLFAVQQVFESPENYIIIPVTIPREGFYKGGLPPGPQLQYVSEKPADPSTSFVFDVRNTTVGLCKNGHTNHDYEKGVGTRMPIAYEKESKTLTSGGQEGTYKNILEGRTFRIIWVKTDQPAGVSYLTQTPQVIRYSGDEITITLI
jgi:hypothetical protein